MGRWKSSQCPPQVPFRAAQDLGTLGARTWVSRGAGPFGLLAVVAMGVLLLVWLQPAERTGEDAESA